MEKELKIVVSVFLFYFIFGFTQVFKTQAFITPVFLTSFILIICALLFWFMNLKESRAFLLILMVGVQFSWAFSDSFFIAFVEYYFPMAGEIIKSKIAGIISLSVFYLMNLFSVLTLFNLKDKKITPLIFLLTPLILSVLLIFSAEPVFFKFSVILFSLAFFFFGQTGSAVETKTLRVVSYQYLLLGLLQCFEYFI